MDFKLDLLKLKTAKLTKVMISDIDFKPSEGDDYLKPLLKLKRAKLTKMKMISKPLQVINH